MAKKQKRAKKPSKQSYEIERLNTMIELTREAMEGTQADTLEGFKNQIQRLEQRIKDLQ